VKRTSKSLEVPDSDGSFRLKAEVRRIKKTPHKPGSSISAMMRREAIQLTVGE